MSTITAEHRLQVRLPQGWRTLPASAPSTWSGWRLEVTSPELPAVLARREQRSRRTGILLRAAWRGDPDASPGAAQLMACLTVTLAPTGSTRTPDPAAVRTALLGSMQMREDDADQLGPAEDVQVADRRALRRAVLLQPRADADHADGMWPVPVLQDRWVWTDDDVLVIADFETPNVLLASIWRPVFASIAETMEVQRAG